jgi:hypothetical protein
VRRSVAHALYLPSQINECVTSVNKSAVSGYHLTVLYPRLQKIDRDCLISRRTPILKVPSAIVPVERNYLFNPEHPDLNYEIESIIKFKFDRRMWK